MYNKNCLLWLEHFNTHDIFESVLYPPLPQPAIVVSMAALVKPAITSQESASVNPMSSAHNVITVGKTITNQILAKAACPVTAIWVAPQTLSVT